MLVYITITGNYTLAATVSGTVVQQITLPVRVYSTPTVMMAAYNLSVTAGSDVTLTCFVGNPKFVYGGEPVYFNWTVNGGPISGKFFPGTSCLVDRHWNQ